MRMSCSWSDDEPTIQGTEIFQRHAFPWQASTLIICYNRLE
jgi:hypothetical protein